MPAQTASPRVPQPSLAKLHPGNFALVMASGILSIGFDALHYPCRVFGFLTLVAAASIVGLAAHQRGFETAAVAWWALRWRSAPTTMSA